MARQIKLISEPLELLQGESDDLGWILSEQLRVMSQQLELLLWKYGEAGPASTVTSTSEPAANVAPATAEATPAPPERHQLSAAEKPIERAPARTSSTDLERALSRIWCDVFELESVSLDRGFFELGGDSLKGMLICSRIRDLFTVEVPLEQLFEAATIRRLATVVEEATRIQTQAVRPESSPRRRPWICRSSTSPAVRRPSAWPRPVPRRRKNSTSRSRISPPRPPRGCRGTDP